MNVEAIVAQLAQTIQKEANVDAIFGQPRKLDEHVVIPVARVEIKINGGGGMGSGTGPQATSATATSDAATASDKPLPTLMGGQGGGAGGGIEVHVLPLGFIRDGKNGAEFLAIDPTPEGLIGKVEHLVKNLRGGPARVAES
ncbi:hypothetical protein ACNOYE_06565 [Nannocystaceae bacterium ST9]